MFELHDAQYSGHGGTNKTYRAIRNMLWRAKLKSDVTMYVSTCSTCQRNKPSNRRHAGLLQPLPIPDGPWDSASMDFITDLPTTSEGYNAILVCVDRLTKMTHLAKCKTNVDSEGTAELFVDHVWKHHGMPLHLVRHRGST